jgi:hypothetical protein
MTKAALLIILLVGGAGAQVTLGGGVQIKGGVSVNGTMSVLPPAGPGAPMLPQVWVNTQVCYPPGGTYDVVKTIPGSYAATMAGLQQSMTDWVAAADQWWHVVITHGTLITGSSPFVLGAKLGATKCIVYDSDTPLTAGQTVCSHGITDGGVVSDAGTRNPGCTSPNDIASMWTLESSSSVSNGQLIQAGVVDSGGNGASHIVIQNAELRPASSVSSSEFAIDLEQPGGGGNTTIASATSYIGFDRDYMHGDASDSALGNNKIAQFLRFGTSYGWLTNSYADHSVKAATDYQIVTGTNSPGPTKINHNWLENGSETILFGGAPPNIPNLVPPDVEIRRNRLTMFLPWCPSPAGSGIAPGTNKNRLEFKQIQRALLDGNIIENSCADGQAGFLHLVNVRACSGGGGCNGGENLFIVDITETNNILRHANQGIGQDGRSDSSGSGNGVSLTENRILMQNELFYDIGDHTRFNGSGSVTLMQTGTGGNSFTANCVRDSSGVNTTCTLTAIDVGFLIQSGMSVNDAVTTTNCGDATFQVGGVTGVGPLAITPTVPTGLTVTFPNAGTANASTTCTTTGNGIGLSNYQGYGRNVNFNHITAVATGQFYIGCSSHNTSQRVQNYTYNNSIQLQDTLQGSGSIGGITCGAVGEGGVNGPFDLTTFKFNHNLISLRLNTRYTEYPGGTTPPTTIYFPQVNSCPGATAPGDGSCPGMTGMMSGAAYELNAADYHDYKLIGTNAQNLYRAGGTRGATDGTDLGVNISAIDTALTQTKYVCATFCGAGPYDDNTGLH